MQYRQANDDGDSVELTSSTNTQSGSSGDKTSLNESDLSFAVCLSILGHVAISVGLLVLCGYIATQ